MQTANIEAIINAVWYFQWDLVNSELSKCIWKGERGKLYKNLNGKIVKSEENIIKHPLAVQKINLNKLINFLTISVKLRSFKLNFLSIFNPT